MSVQINIKNAKPTLTNDLSQWAHTYPCLNFRDIRIDKYCIIPYHMYFIHTVHSIRDAVLRGPKVKNSPLSLGIILMILWKRFYDVLISSHEVFKLQSLYPPWVRSYSRMYSLLVFLFVFLFISWKMNVFHSFMVVLTISHELMKLSCFEWLNWVST